MSRALALAAKAIGQTSPNPMVGAVLVKNGKIIAEDYHRRPGTPHAEALVIKKAGDKARSSTLYVSLEPCCHTDKRTPPCAKAIIQAGISRVFVAMKDPNPKVSGKGIGELKAAGIDVVSGLLQEKAKKLNEAYSKYITTGKPFVTLKVAMTLDGKIATPEGQSKWITGEKARGIVHRMRSSVDAVMTAVGTVKADDPELTARIKGGKNPKRIIIDPGLDTPLTARILRIPPETILVGRDDRERNPLFELKVINIEKTGASVLLFKDTLNLNWLVSRLSEMEVTSILIEGGSSLNAHALEDGIVDKLMFFIAPKIIGGRESFPAIGGRTFRRLEDSYKIRNMSCRKVGEDLLIEGYL